MKTPNTPELKEQLDNAPKKPGVYKYSNHKGEVIYVGKAINLFNRSRSYFLNYKRLDPRIQMMVDRAESIEYLVVDNEIEALILETNLIKKYKPKYNVLMVDDKSYLWVKVEKQQDFPRISIVREKQKDNADYFGPFPNKGPVKRMLKNLRKVFPYRSCNRVIEIREDKSGKKYVYSSDTKPCLYYHLGLCDAPCTGKLPKTKYRKQVNNFKRFFRSGHHELKKSMQTEMKTFSKDRKYEKAAEVRDQLRDLDYLTTYTRFGSEIDEDALVKRKRKQSLQGVEELITKLHINYPLADKELEKFRIEAYDISNIQGTNATSAMVVAIGGKKKTSDYRKFKIKSKSTPDDFAMLQETLQRRLKYLESDNTKKDKSFSQWPNLLVIDGGKGQLSSVLKIINAIGDEKISDIPIIGLAKREEEVFIPDYSSGELKFDSIRISRRSPALRILQLVRDEAHRFGLGYHRKLRSKGMVYSQLDLIPGVGEVTRKKLILAFGSVEGIKKASISEVESVVKNRNTAMKIKKLLV